LQWQESVPATNIDRKVGGTMSQRESNLLWLRDMLEHLTASQQQLEWTEDSEAVQVITETMLRDLDCCRRICEGLRRRSAVRQAV
jgi:hypothetical protein